MFVSFSIFSCHGDTYFLLRLSTTTSTVTSTIMTTSSAPMQTARINTTNETKHPVRIVALIMHHAVNISPAVYSTVAMCTLLVLRVDLVRPCWLQHFNCSVTLSVCDFCRTANARWQHSHSMRHLLDTNYVKSSRSASP